MADRMGQAKLPRATRVKSKQAADRQVSHFRQTEGEDDDDEDEDASVPCPRSTLIPF